MTAAVSSRSCFELSPNNGLTLTIATIQRGYGVLTMDGFSYDGTRAVNDRRAPEGWLVTAIIARLLLKERSLSGSSAGP